MEYRRATIEDVPTLVKLRIRQLIDEGSQPTRSIDAELSSYFEENLPGESLIVWLAVDGGAVIATGGVCFFQLPPFFSNPSGKMAYVTNMYTDPAYRRRGIATALIKRLLGEARERGITLIRLHASQDGRRVYERIGFTQSEGYMSMRLP